MDVGKGGYRKSAKEVCQSGWKEKSSCYSFFASIYVSRLACKYMEMLHLKKVGLQFQFSCAYGKVSVDSFSLSNLQSHDFLQHQVNQSYFFVKGQGIKSAGL